VIWQNDRNLHKISFSPEKENTSSCTSLAEFSEQNLQNYNFLTIAVSPLKAESCDKFGLCPDLDFSIAFEYCDGSFSRRRPLSSSFGGQRLPARGCSQDQNYSKPCVLPELRSEREYCALGAGYFGNHDGGMLWKN